MVIFLVYAVIVDKYQTIDTYPGYLYLLTLAVLCAQSLGHISGIVFSANQNTAILFSIGLMISFVFVGNYLIPFKEIPRLFQYLGQLSFIKHSFESIVILNYGFDRCSDNQLSLVLHRFGIETKDYEFNCIYLLFDLICLKIIALIILIFKTNRFYTYKY